MLGKIVDALSQQVHAVLPDVAIRVGPPRARSESDPLEVAIWLYHLSEDAVSGVSTYDPSRAFIAPRLCLSLHYLLVAGGGSHRAAHDATGLLWRGLHHQSLTDSEDKSGVGVDLQLDPLDADRMAHLWATLAPLPMQPAVAVTVRGVEP
jgi:hypothetical protein